MTRSEVQSATGPLGKCLLANLQYEAGMYQALYENANAMNRAFAAERTLENIRDNAATMSNGGAWAAGLAVIRLAASERSSTSESLDLADHDEISRKVLGLPWAVQSAIVTMAAHCTVIKDKSPAGDVSDLAGCISQDLLELANALSGGVAQAAPEPVAWRMWPLPDDGKFQELTASHSVMTARKAAGWFVAPLFTSPVPSASRGTEA